MQTDFEANAGTHGHNCTSFQSPTPGWSAPTQNWDQDGHQGRPLWPFSALAGTSERESSHYFEEFASETAVRY